MREAAQHEVTCGTTGCAMGYAPVAMPRLFAYDRVGVPYMKKQPNIQGMEAARYAFGITDDEWWYLFQESRYPKRGGTSPKTVAARLRRFVKHGMPKGKIRVYYDHI